MAALTVKHVGVGTMHSPGLVIACPSGTASDTKGDPRGMMSKDSGRPERSAGAWKGRRWSESTWPVRLAPADSPVCAVARRADVKCFPAPSVNAFGVQRCHLFIVCGGHNCG